MTRRPELVEIVARAISPNIFDESSAQYPHDHKPRERARRRAERVLAAIDLWNKENQE